MFVSKSRIAAQFPPVETLNQVFELGGPTGLKWRERTPETFASSTDRTAKAWNRRFAGKPAGTLRLKPGSSLNPIDDQKLAVFECRQPARVVLGNVSYAVADLVAVLATGVAFNTKTHTVTHDDGDPWNCDPAYLSIVPYAMATHPSPFVLRDKTKGEKRLRSSRLPPLQQLVWDSFVDRPGVLCRHPSAVKILNEISQKEEVYGAVIFLKDLTSIPESVIRLCAETPPNLMSARSYATSRKFLDYPRRFGKQFLKYLLSGFPEFFKLRSGRVYLSGTPRQWREAALSKLYSPYIKPPEKLEVPFEMTWSQFDRDPDARIIVAYGDTGEIIGSRRATPVGQAEQYLARSPSGSNKQYPDAPPGWVMPPPPPGFEPATKDRPAGRFVAPVEPVVLPWNEDPNYWDHSTAEPPVEEDDDTSPADLRVVR